MAFTEVFNATVLSETYTVLAPATEAGQNFLIRVPSLDLDEIQPVGYVLWRIYVPNPVDEFAVVRSEGIRSRDAIFFNPIPMLAGLNVEVGYYIPRNLAARNIRLLLE